MKVTAAVTEAKGAPDHQAGSEGRLIRTVIRNRTHGRLT
jgi:hypothetical protein